MTGITITYSASAAKEAHMSHDDESRFIELLSRLTLEEKIRVVTGQDFWSLYPLPSIGLRSIVVSDGPVGVRGDSWDERSPSINFPSPTAMASSWDPELLGRIGEALGREARRKGVDVVLAPTINLHRTPYGGRHFEAFSEDPILSASLARAYVEGIQRQGVGATVKHYVANDSETDRFTVDVRVSDRALRELYLLAFEEPVVDGHAWLVMSAYNSINGATATENPLLQTPLNDDWGFDGVVISDWTAVRSVESARHPQDLAMPGPDGAWGDALLDAVKAGEVDEKDVDRKVLRILRLASRVGALEGFEQGPVTGDERVSRETAREASARGTVLLRNDGILPLSSPTSIAVIGEGARWARTQGGGSATVIPSAVRSPLDGLRERWPSAQVTWSHGAIVQTSIADLDSGTFTFDGQPGMLVRYLDGEEHEIGREVRLASGIVSFEAGSLGARSSVIEMALLYHPGVETDLVPFAVAGVCDWQLEADGVVVASGRLRTKPGDDPATGVLSPPWEAVQVPMTGGGVDLVVRFTPAASDIPGAFALRVGTPPRLGEDELLLRAAIEAARAADVAVVVVSTNSDVESEGFDRANLRLPGLQDELVQAVVAANPRTIVVVNSGAPVLLPWSDAAAAVLAVWFPGQEFGDALADVLSGDVEPGGRLPVTWPASEADLPVRSVTPTDGRLEYSEGIHIGYRAWLRAGSTPAFPFGWGLGFTSWSMDGLLTEVDDDHVRVAVTVANTGARTGSTVVQLYAERPDSDIERPVTWLIGSAIVTAPAGESATANIDVPWRRFAHWNGRWDLELGRFRIRAAFSVADEGVVEWIEAPAL